MNGLTNKMDNYQPVEQGGFRKSFSTSDHLLTIRILIEKSNQYNLPLYFAFVEYEKAFDTLEFWTIKVVLINSRIDSRYITMLESINANSKITIQLDENLKTSAI